MVTIDPNKIPVRIIEAQDIHGNKQVGVTLDISYYVETEGDPSKKVEEFKKLYFSTLSKAKKLFGKKKRKTSTQYWKLSKILQEFNEKTENEFSITNYRTALQRDFGLTDSYVGVIFDFGKFFEENQVIDKIPFSVYFELLLKARRLSKLGLFEKEKKRFLEISKKGKIPGHKEYRNELRRLFAD